MDLKSTVTLTGLEAKAYQLTEVLPKHGPATIAVLKVFRAQWESSLGLVRIYDLAKDLYPASDITEMGTLHAIKKLVQEGVLRARGNVGEKSYELAY